MRKIKNLFLILIVCSTIFTLQGCLWYTGDFFEKLFDPNLIIIRGPKTISGETYEIKPGATVRFKCSKYGFGEDKEEGQLVFTNGGKLVANGQEERIILEAGEGYYEGRVVFEASASTESIVQYCEFNHIPIDMEVSIPIRHVKFIGCCIGCRLGISSVIEYNTFDGDGFASSAIQAEAGENVSPVIRYNEIKNTIGKGMYFSENENPTIEWNNITNCEDEAIAWYNEDGGGVPPPTQELIVSNNYIANCNGKSGVDTIGEQCFNVTYQNLQSAPVDGAGCGW